MATELSHVFFSFFSFFFVVVAVVNNPKGPKIIIWLLYFRILHWMMNGAIDVSE